MSSRVRELVQNCAKCRVHAPVTVQLDMHGNLKSEERVTSRHRPLQIDGPEADIEDVRPVIRARYRSKAAVRKSAGSPAGARPGATTSVAVA